MWRTSSQDAPWPSCLPTSRRIWRHLPSLGDKERIPLREAPSQLQRLASTFQPPYIQPVLISAGLTPTVQARFSERRPGFLLSSPNSFCRKSNFICNASGRVRSRSPRLCRSGHLFADGAIRSAEQAIAQCVSRAGRRLSGVENAYDTSRHRSNRIACKSSHCACPG